jgi:hypothetical protein
MPHNRLIVEEKASASSLYFRAGIGLAATSQAVDSAIGHLGKAETYFDVFQSSSKATAYPIYLLFYCKLKRILLSARCLVFDYHIA